MKIKTDSDRTLVDFLFEQLAAIDDLRFRRMFGAYGIYAGTLFFALVHDGRIYFKTNFDTRGRYENAQMGPFAINGEVILKNYFQLPIEVLEDQDALQIWAHEAISIATEPKPKKKRQRPQAAELPPHWR